MRIEVDRLESSAPINLSVSREFQGGVPGLVPTIEVRQGSTVDYYLDFADMTLKTSGWTLRSLTLSAVGSGHYTLLGGLNVGGITNLPSDVETLVVEYTIDNGGKDKAIGHDIIQLTSTLATLSSMMDKICEILACGKNRMEIDSSTDEMVLYNDDGITEMGRWPLSTNGGEGLVYPFGVQTKRGAFVGT